MPIDAHDLTPILKQGLRQDARNPRNSLFATEYINAKARGFGLVQYDAVSQLIAGAELTAESITVDFPYPQVFRGSRHSILVTATRVFEIDEATWTLTELTFHATETSGTEVLDPNPGVGGNPWTVNTGTWLSTSGVISCTVASSLAEIAQLAADVITPLVTGALYRVGFHVNFNQAISNPNSYVKVTVGGASGTQHNTEGYFYEDIIAGASGNISFIVNNAVCDIISYTVKKIELAVLTQDSQWAFMDGGNTWALTNNTWVAMRAYNGRHYASNAMSIRTGCFTRGRFITGGFNTSNSVPAAQNTIGGQLYADIPHTRMSANIIGNNWVQWSGIADQSFWWFFFPHVMKYGINGGYSGFDDGKFYYMDVIQKGDLGAMPMHWQGVVRAIKPFGTGVLVYGDEGVAYLYLVSEPAPTFGYRNVLDIGIPSRGAVGGTESQQIMIDNEGTMWKLTLAEKGVSTERLGYNEFFLPLIAEIFSICYDPEEAEWYITTETKGYCLGSGLTEIPQRVFSLTFADGGQAGFYETSGNTGFSFETDILTFNTVRPKTLFEVILETENTDDLSLIVDYRNDLSASFSSTSAISFRRNGAATVNVTAVEFRIRITATAYAGINIDTMKCLIKVNEKMGMGVYA